MKSHLKELCLIPGLSGYEDNVRKYLQHQLNSINLKNTTPEENDRVDPID